MSSFVARWCSLLCLLWCLVAWSRRALADENRPYEFSFNIVDFQHRYEKKDDDGIVTGEYGFITGDGVYHETGYATDKNGDFIITRMRNRKITSLKDAQEIFKGRPEAAKKLLEAVAKACGSCNIPIKQENKRPEPTKAPVTEPPPPPPQQKMSPILKQMMKTLSETVKSEGKKKPAEDVVRNMVRTAKELPLEGGPSRMDDRALEKMANDLYYQFNYTITTHGHHESGYRDGRKEGSFRSRSENGVDTQVRYVSNEFGHQPNVTFVPQANAVDEEHALKGYLFRWHWP